MTEPALEEPAHGARIDDMLLSQHAGGERRGVVAGAHRHRGLDDDRPVVELRRDEMHGAAVHLDAGGKRALMRMRGRETPAAATDGC